MFEKGVLTAGGAVSLPPICAWPLRPDKPALLLLLLSVGLLCEGGAAWRGCRGWSR